MTLPRTNWSGNVVFGAAAVVRPGSLGELQELVASRRPVRALGAGHSFTPVADTEGTLVSLDRLGGSVDVDAGGRRAWVPAGATYDWVGSRLHAAGHALANLASVPHVTVAGACATGTHGSGPGNPGLPAAVSSLEMVRADGELVTLRRGEEDFAGAVVSLGAIGVVTRLELEVEPTYEVAQEVWTHVPLPGRATRSPSCSRGATASACSPTGPNRTRSARCGSSAASTGRRRTRSATWSAGAGPLPPSTRWPAATRLAPPSSSDALAPLDPRPHWGKLSAMGPEDLARAYPRLGEFRALAETMDPEGRFANRFVDWRIGR